MRKVTKGYFEQSKAKSRFLPLEFEVPCDNRDMRVYGTELSNNQVMLVAVFNNDIATVISIVNGCIIECEGRYMFEAESTDNVLPITPDTFEPDCEVESQFDEDDGGEYSQPSKSEEVEMDARMEAIMANTTPEEMARYENEKREEERAKDDFAEVKDMIETSRKNNEAEKVLREAAINSTMKPEKSFKEEEVKPIITTGRATVEREVKKPEVKPPSFIRNESAPIPKVVKPESESQQKPNFKDKNRNKEHVKPTTEGSKNIGGKVYVPTKRDENRPKVKSCWGSDWALKG